MKYNDFLDGLFSKVKANDELNVSKKDMKGVLDTFVEYATEKAKSGEEVKLPNFGKFYTTEKHNVKVRNPHTGQQMVKPKVVRFNFTPFSSLKKKMYE